MTERRWRRGGKREGGVLVDDGADVGDRVWGGYEVGRRGGGMEESQVGPEDWPTKGQRHDGPWVIAHQIRDAQYTTCLREKLPQRLLQLFWRGDAQILGHVFKKAGLRRGWFGLLGRCLGGDDSVFGNTLEVVQRAIVSMRARPTNDQHLGKFLLDGWGLFFECSGIPKVGDIRLVYFW